MLPLNIVSPQHLAQIVEMVRLGEITRKTGIEVMEYYIQLGTKRAEAGLTPRP